MLNYSLSHIRSIISKNALPIDHEIISNKELRKSAVLIPLIQHKDQLSILYTKRSNSVDKHKSQLSFPGGVFEKNDQTILDTALRETEEEIGIPRYLIEIFGRMGPFDSNTGFYIFPFVGSIQNTEKIKKNGSEVQKIICIPLIWILNKQNSHIEDYLTECGLIKKVRFFELYEGEKLWGITAKITYVLVNLIKNERN